MRIVSLLPAATEWIAAFGGLEDLVGCSHECSGPPGIADIPVVTEARFDDSGDSAAIDRAVRDALEQGLSLYDVDMERLKALDPDLIVTQDQCDVCAVSLSQLREELATWGSGDGPDIFSLKPNTFKDVLDGALRLGRAIGRTSKAMRVIAGGEMRLQQLRSALGVDRRVEPETLQTVACIEWLDPLMVAGHWMPDLAEHAGARSILAEKGDASPTIEFDALVEADPAAIAIMPCGFSVDQTVGDMERLTSRSAWRDLRAVRSGNVAILDGNAYFNRPGPRLVRSAELLASVVHRRDDVLRRPIRDGERIWLEEMPDGAS
ncbi:cobalamin-binding protein [Longibacter salinarum]|uniref:Cobalamin-binding protein n=1 Tax=Longibacter salinarum TaxID=1850348 RepID=A0A2A8CX45_9BACT|nr:cobalamin-binding protein [Longibacter salinarum]PEN12958.1 cobalamin-binding protein [Longibacter salinarum]